MLTKKILACALSLTMAMSAAATGFSVINADISASADSLSTTEKYTAVRNLVLGAPNIIENNYNYNKYKFNFTLTKSGVLTVSDRNVYNAALYNSNGKAIDNYTSSGEKYTLNAGSYYIVVTAHYSNDSGNGEIFANFTPSYETFKDSGNGIATSNTIKFSSKTNTAKVKGFFAEYSNDTSDSYKINVTSRTGLAIAFSTANSISCELEIYNSKKQRVFYEDYLDNASYANKCYVKLNKGTYYIRIINKYPILHKGGYYLKLRKYNPKTSHVIKLNTTKVSGKSVSDYSGYVKYATNYSKDKVTFKSSNTKVFTVNSNGYVTFKGPGKAYLTVTAGSSSVYDSVSRTVPIYVTPKKVRGFSSKIISRGITTANSKISWTRDANATGYVFTYSYKKNSNDSLISPKRVVLRSNKKNYFVFKNLKKNKRVYFKVRSYKVVGKKVLYGPESNTMYYMLY